MSFPDGDFLTLRIGGGPAHPERLLLIGRPQGGLARVREWTSNSLNTEGEEYDADPQTLLGEIERAYDARRSVSEEMFRVRSWLTGTA